MKSIKRVRENCSYVNNYCRSMAGIVTAANEYFILNHQEVYDRDLSDWAKPILKKGAYLAPGPVLTIEAFQRIAASYPTLLLDFNGIDTENLPHSVQEYLEIGIARGSTIPTNHGIGSVGIKCRSYSRRQRSSLSDRTCFREFA